jgi:hypothetical protein
MTYVLHRLVTEVENKKPAKLQACRLLILALSLFAMFATTVRVAWAQAGPPPWTVGIQPTAQAQSSNTFAVTITWCDKNFPLSSTRSIVFKGQNVTSQFTYTYFGYGINDCAQYYSGTAVYGGKSTGTVTLTGGQTIDTLVASIYNGNGTLLSATKTWTPANYLMSITPHGGRTTPAPNTANLTQTFNVTNHGNSAANYALQLTCSGAIAGCSAPSTVSVFPGMSATVNVSYASGSPESKGLIQLKASYSGGSQTWSDVGSVYTVASTTLVPNTRVLVGEVNPGTTVDRSGCLKIALARDLASDCGVLRISYALPSVRTLNTRRAPTLVYYGDQVAAPVLATHVILADTASVPDSVRLNVQEVLTNGSLRAISGLPRTYPGTAWATGRAQRLSAVLPVSATQIFKYQVNVSLLYGGVWRAAADSVVGELAIIDRKSSRFGAGWWLAGLERLYTNQAGGVLWVGGDGSTRKYSRSSVLGTDTVYVTEALTRPDSLYRDSQGTFRRALPNGAHVYFDPSGLHTRTVNRSGHVTRFVWGVVSGEPRLDSIVVPTPVGAIRAYQFRYNAQGALYSVLAPQNPNSPREVLLTRTTNALGRGVARIVDPSLDSVKFEFPSGSDTTYLASLSRRGARTEFANEVQSPTLASSVTPTGDGDTVRYDFRTVIGAGASSTASPIQVDSVYFRYTNPRRAVTKIWVDRFGQPLRLINALGNTTTVRHDDWRFPEAVTRVEYPILADGRPRVTAALFDAGGNLTTTVEVNPYGADGNNRDAVTRYGYDNVAWPNFVTRIVRPERDSIVIAYDASGNRSTQYDARGDSTRLFLYYGNAWGLLSSAWQSSIRTDSLEYSALGNLQKVRTAQGFITTLAQDSIGRDTLYQAPIDSAQTLFWRSRTAYDVADRVLLDATTGDSTPGPNGVSAQTLFAQNTYDEDGNLKSLTRWSSPDVPFHTTTQPNPIGHIVTRWDYDLLNRKTREYAPDTSAANLLDNPVDETRYDVNGNVVSLIKRGRDALHRDTITMVYDTLDRLKLKRVPRVTYPSRLGIIQNIQQTPNSWYGDDSTEKMTPYPRYPNDPQNPGVYTIPVDTARFDYNELGYMTRADNRDALVHRGYYLNGLVRADSQIIRTGADTSSPGGNMSTTHRYALSYLYDLDGRRTLLRHPQQLAPSPSQNQNKVRLQRGWLSRLSDRHVRLPLHL